MQNNIFGAGRVSVVPVSPQEKCNAMREYLRNSVQTFPFFALHKRSGQSMIAYIPLKNVSKILRGEEGGGFADDNVACHV